MLNKAEARTDSAQAEMQAAQRMLAVEQAARQMAEQMLAAEAARADAAGDCPLHEKSIQSSVFPRIFACSSVSALHLARRMLLPDPKGLNCAKTRPCLLFVPTEESAENEHRARRQAEAQRDIF